MATLIERTTLDLRFQDYRMRDDAREARLRASIAQRGIEEPLEGIDLVDEEEPQGAPDQNPPDQNSPDAIDRAKSAVADIRSASAPTTKIRHVLLNGFQRYRCAERLGIHEVPYVALAQDETAGIVHLLRVAKQQRLGILEEAKFIDELMTIHGQSLVDVAQALARSKAWVSMRRGLLKEMTPGVQAILFRGTFAMRSTRCTRRGCRCAGLAAR